MGSIPMQYDNMYVSFYILTGRQTSQLRGPAAFEDIQHCTFAPIDATPNPAPTQCQMTNK